MKKISKNLQTLMRKSYGIQIGLNSQPPIENEKGRAIFAARPTSRLPIPCVIQAETRPTPTLMR